MLEDITLGQISMAVVFIVGLYGGVKYLKKEIKDFLNKLLDSKLLPLNKKLDDMQNAITDLDVQATKNFLVRYLADIEREDVIFDTERERFWEEYDHYTDELGKNSFIKEWVNKLKSEGKLVRPTKEE
jgi:hypothetical protein